MGFLARKRADSGVGILARVVGAGKGAGAGGGGGRCCRWRRAGGREWDGRDCRGGRVMPGFEYCRGLLTWSWCDGDVQRDDGSRFRDVPNGTSAPPHHHLNSSPSLIHITQTSQRQRSPATSLSAHSPPPPHSSPSPSPPRPMPTHPHPSASPPAPTSAPSPRRSMDTACRCGAFGRGGFGRCSGAAV